MRIFAPLLILLLCLAAPARAELPTPAAMDLYCNVLPGKATQSWYHQPDGQLASGQVLALKPGEYVTKQDVHVFILPSNAYLMQFPEKTDVVEATRGPDFMAFWTKEHPIAMGGCSLQQLSEALRRNKQELWYSLPDDPESWLNIREAEGEEVHIPDNKVDTGYVEVYARFPTPEVLSAFCHNAPPDHSLRAPKMPAVGEHKLSPAGLLVVYDADEYLVFIPPSAARVFGDAHRDIFFPADTDRPKTGGRADELMTMNALGGCRAGQLANVLAKNGLTLAETGE